MTEMDPFTAFISNLGTRPRDEADLETVKHELYFAVMRQEWDNVVEIYKKHRMIHATTITNSDDTALHVAITHGAPESSVLELVDEIDNVETAMEILVAKNNREETPLHCAASRGSLSVCRRIVHIDETLVRERNKAGETPLFLAALNGHRQTFLYLHSVCKKMTMLEEENISSRSSLWRRNGGDTILHCTIQREYFDLSVYIIDQYKDQNIASSINIEGITPLHVLARKPSAFRSCTRLSWWQNLCYNYIRVEKLKPLFQHSLLVDIEHWTDAPAESHQSRGYSRIRKIKEKHVWGSQIMDELITQNRDYQFNDNESAPFLDLSDFKELEKINEKSEAKEKGDEQSQEEKPSKTDKILATKYGLTEAVDKILKEIPVAIPDHETTGNKNIVLVAIQERQTHVPSKTDKTALLIATKYGLREAVEKILKETPVAIHDHETTGNKNIVLVAIQERQTHVLKLLMKQPLWLNLREAVDVEGNNALHLAAKLSKTMPWEIPGSAMQMQWEVKWFEYVKENMPTHLYSQTNKQGETPGEIFAEQHRNLVKESNDWLKDTSGSYSIVAALTAGVTFATAYTVPGGNDQSTGKPILGGQPAFNIFAISVLLSFSFSITALAAFLDVYSSRKQPKDFRKNLPLKLLLGLTSFFVSIVSMLVSFCAAHSFELERRKKYKVITSPLYSITLLPLCFYTVAQIPLYWDLLRASFTKVPQPKYVGEEVPI